MNINIYYGGRGLIDDPTLFVLGKMQNVLEELHVNVSRYNLQEYKNGIITLPQTLKDADGIILASTVEWFGIGGYMQQFLDACWLYGDKEKISKIYMCPVVMSTTYGEREGKMNLATAWEILGGKPCSGICGYIASTINLEMNEDYTAIVEKKAENLYRTINQKYTSFPASNQAVKNMVSFTQNIDLTPQESEQLSEYASDDGYVQRQKEDLQELTSMFMDMLNETDGGKHDLVVKALCKAFHPQQGVKATFFLKEERANGGYFISVQDDQLKVEYGPGKEAEVEMTAQGGIIDEITGGRMSFNRAFMSGSLKMKGNFKTMRILDTLFVF